MEGEIFLPLGILHVSGLQYWLWPSQPSTTLMTMVPFVNCLVIVLGGLPGPP